jgi:hypothetical protein
MTDFKESLRTVARDLFNLEINTVIKDTMTARKMPDPANAILDIAQTYATKLLELGIPLGYAFAEGDPDFQKPVKEWSKEPFSYDRLEIGVDTFGRLRWASVAGQRGLENLAADDRIVIVRIAGNCDQLKGLLQRLEDTLKSAGIAGENRRGLSRKMTSSQSRSLLRLQPDDLTMVCKMWEVGVEKVVMQSVIQLDGDVITRIQRRYAEQDQRHVFEFHKMSVDLSVRFWGVMANTVAVFLGSLVGILGGSRNPIKAPKVVIPDNEEP